MWNNNTNSNGQQTQNQNDMSWIAAAAGLLGGIVNNVGANSRQKKQNEANRELAEYQWNKNLEMWNMQNEYNNPANQMSRLREAGLNPNMVYGSGSVAGNTGSSMPQYSAPRMERNWQPIDIGSNLGLYQNFQLKQAQTDNVKETTKMIAERNKTEQIARALKVSELGIKDEEIKRRRGTTSYFIESAKHKTAQEAQKAIQAIINTDIKNLERDVKQGEVDRIPAKNMKAVQDALYSKYKSEWAKYGITSSDNAILRVLAKMWFRLGADGAVQGLDQLLPWKK